jgi:hypothetical protein
VLGSRTGATAILDIGMQKLRSCRRLLELLRAGTEARATTGLSQIREQQQRPFSRLPEDFEKYYRKQALKPKVSIPRQPVAGEAATGAEAASTSGRAASVPLDEQQAGAQAGQ